jgi:hypothetical protein
VHRRNQSRRKQCKQHQGNARHEPKLGRLRGPGKDCAIGSIAVGRSAAPEARASRRDACSGSRAPCNASAYEPEARMGGPSHLAAVNAGPALGRTPFAGNEQQPGALRLLLRSVSCEIRRGGDACP